MRSRTRGLASRAVLLAAALVLPMTVAAQTVLDRPPNLSAAWIGSTGTLQFNFLHRFAVSSAPQRAVSNSPSFLLSYRLPPPVMIGLVYATSSDVTPSFPNEYELFARWRPLGQGGGAPLDVAVQGGYNNAAESVDGELTVARDIGRLRLIGVARYLSDGYGAGEARYAFGAGATIRLSRFVALAGDVASLADRATGEEVAWGAALQLAIPSSPHSLSLQVTNTTTATLQGSSRGLEDLRGGFEFTIPITFSRYFGKRATTAGTATVTPSAPEDPSHTRIEMRNVVFAQSTIEIAAGGGIAFVNQDPMVHTVTADDGSFDSGPIEPGATWRRVFDRPGTYAIHCTPHPFMKTTVVVR